MSNTFKEVVQKYSADSDEAGRVVDEITEASPLFQIMPFQETNDGMTHIYEELKAIQAAQSVNLNAAYPTIGADFNLTDRDIDLIAGIRQVHTNTVDRLYNGSIEAYLDKQMKPIMSQTLMDLSFESYYDVIRPFAKEKGKLITEQASPVGANYFSLWIVRFQEDQFTGLYNPEFAGSRGVFSVDTGNGWHVENGKPVYNLKVEMTTGILPANGRNVSGIVNIDLDDVNSSADKKAAFARKVTDQLVQARPGTGGRTYIVGNPILISTLENLEQASQVVDNNVVRSTWNGIPMIGDWNLLEGSEDPYSLS